MTSNARGQVRTVDLSRHAAEMASRLVVAGRDEDSRLAKSRQVLACRIGPSRSGGTGEETSIRWGLGSTGPMSPVDQDWHGTIWLATVWVAESQGMEKARQEVSERPGVAWSGVAGRQERARFARHWLVAERGRDER
jgi:hypothetical protein